MSRIEELIKEKCPDGVSYKSISEVCHIIAGGDAPKGHMSDEKTDEYAIPIYSNGIGDNALYGYTDEAKIFEKCVTISARGTIGWAALRTEPFYPIVRLICAVPKNSEEIVAEYLYFFMQTLSFQVPDGGIPQLTVPMIAKKEVPIPPIEVQQEIVCILDKFTELEAELQAELDARKKQYEYYRDKLLNFGDNVEYRSLGDSCYIKARIGWQKLNKSEYLSEGDYYLVTGVNITKANRVNFDECYFVSKERYEMDVNIQLQNGDIIITKDGTIGKVALIEEMDKPAVLNSHLFVIRDITGKLNHKFLLYVFLSNYFTRFVEGNKTSGTIAGLNQATMVKFNIPFPSLDEQERIVEILDKFVQLIERLTKEIEIRHKQYEYYRDKLLTFKRKVV